MDVRVNKMDATPNFQREKMGDERGCPCIQFEIKRLYAGIVTFYIAKRNYVWEDLINIVDFSSLLGDYITQARLVLTIFGNGGGVQNLFE